MAITVEELEIVVRAKVSEALKELKSLAPAIRQVANASKTNATQMANSMKKAFNPDVVNFKLFQDGKQVIEGVKTSTKRLTGQVEQLSRAYEKARRSQKKLQTGTSTTSSRGYLKSGAVTPLPNLQAQTKTSYVDLSSSAKQYGTIATQNINKVSSSLKKGIKTIGRYALALVGIRGIFAALRRASSAYMEMDTDLSNQMQSNWRAIGAVLAPIITWLSNALAKVSYFINAFVKALTGIDYIAKANAKAINNQAKATKALTNSTADFDEVSNIQKDETGGTSDETNTIALGLSDEETTKIEEFATNAVKIFTELWEKLKYLAGAFWVGLQTVFLIVGGAIAGVVAGIWEVIQGLFYGLVDIFGGVFGGLWTIVSETFGGIWDIISGVFSGIIKTITGVFTGNWKKAWEGLKDIFSSVINGIWRIIKGLWDGLKKAFTGIVKGIGNVFIGIINRVIQVINGVISGLNMIKIPDWVPGVGGKGVNIKKINKISYLAKGGVAYDNTLAMIGEYRGASNNPEIVSPQSIMKDTFLNALQEYSGSGNIQLEIPVKVNGKEIARASIDDLNNLLKVKGYKPIFA